MDLAFPVPEHLPRAKTQQPDISTQILTALGESSVVTIQSTDKWTDEIEQAILQIKKSVHDRLHQESTTFDKQMGESKNVQIRLGTLTSKADSLSSDLTDPEKGTLPNILNVLRRHSNLAQRSLDAEVTKKSLEALNASRKSYQKLDSLVQAGNLSAAVLECRQLQDRVISLPSPLSRSMAILDLQARLRSTYDRLQEQLGKAYSECISIGETQFKIKGQYTSKISLMDVLKSIPEVELSSNLAAMRRDILGKYVDRIINGSVSLRRTSVSVLEVQTLTNESALVTLKELFQFIHDQLLPHLPESSRSSYASSFYGKLSDTIQINLFASLIPGSIDGLPKYLESMREAIQFEKDLIALGFFSGGENRIQKWAEGAQTHYEKQRRTQFLDLTRHAILQDSERPLRVEVESLPETVDLDTTEGPVEQVQEEEPSNWDFDDAEAEASKPTTQTNKLSDKPKESEPEEESGWGFDDDDEPTVDDKQPESDDPWGVEWDDPPAEDAAPIVASSQMETRGSHEKTTSSSKISPSKKPKESYLVSHAAKVVASQAEDVLSESLALISSDPFEKQGFRSTSPSLLLSAISSLFDMYRAMYLVSRKPEPKHGRRQDLQYANDCNYLASKAKQLQHRFEVEGSLKDSVQDSIIIKLEETVQRLEVVSSSWLDDVIDRETEAFLAEFGPDILADLSYDARFEEAQEKFSRIKGSIVALARDLKEYLTASSCYHALGSTIDRLLQQIINDILTMDNISTIQSERIAGLCRILHPMDTLFPELENGVSTVASYVPSWLRFTYLSDILEGTLSDISSWYESGHLIDYEPAELSHLIKALFAESALRTTTINRILSGQSH
ncbi:hypothetical protein CPB86DRAFT_804351 [Serendipita vermifera]|nr:hypothetical protein CPB86DRAFT_804351 [Serendipita vermifera]